MRRRYAVRFTRETQKSMYQMPEMINYKSPVIKIQKKKERSEKKLANIFASLIPQTWKICKSTQPVPLLGPCSHQSICKNGLSGLNGECMVIACCCFTEQRQPGQHRRTCRGQQWQWQRHQWKWSWS